MDSITVSFPTSNGEYNYFAGISNNNLVTFGAPAGITANALARDSLGNIYIGGTTNNAFGAAFILYNGTTFTSIAGGSFNGSIESLTVDSNNSVYIGGQFTTIGARTFNRVACYSGGTYVAMGGGVNGCLLYTSPSPRDRQKSRMPSSA